MTKVQKRVVFTYFSNIDNDVKHAIEQTCENDAFCKTEAEAIKGANEELDGNDGDSFRIVKLTIEVEEKSRTISPKKNDKIDWGIDD